jgi:hypothetical protein
MIIVQRSVFYFYFGVVMILFVLIMSFLLAVIELYFSTLFVNDFIVEYNTMIMIVAVC